MYGYRHLGKIKALDFFFINLLIKRFNISIFMLCTNNNNNYCAHPMSLLPDNTLPDFPRVSRRFFFVLITPETVEHTTEINSLTTIK